MRILSQLEKDAMKRSMYQHQIDGFQAIWSCPHHEESKSYKSKLKDHTKPYRFDLSSSLPSEAGPEECPITHKLGQHEKSKT